MKHRIEITKADREAVKNIEIRIHQEFLPKINGAMLHFAFAGVLMGILLVSIWVVRPEQFGTTTNVILTIVFILLYILITRGMLDFISKALHSVSGVAIREHRLATESIKEKKRNAKSTNN